MAEYGTVLAARISADFRFREKLCKDKRGGRTQKRGEGRGKAGHTLSVQ